MAKPNIKVFESVTKLEGEVLRRARILLGSDSNCSIVRKVAPSGATHVYTRKVSVNVGYLSSSSWSSYLLKNAKFDNGKVEIDDEMIAEAARRLRDDTEWY